MKKTSFLKAPICFIIVLIMASCNATNKDNKATNRSTETTVAAPIQAPAGKIAYVDIDTLSSKYIAFKTKISEFETRKKNIEQELQRTASSIQNEYNAFQKKAQGGGMSQTEGENAQRHLSQLQQAFEAHRESLNKQLVTDQEMFNKNMQNKLDSFLEDYNKDRHYDYILSYAKGGSILFGNKSLNITTEVLNGLNAKYQMDNNSKGNKNE